VAIGWIVASDSLLAAVGLDARGSMAAGLLKGLAFVAVSGLVLYWRLFENFNGLERARVDLAAAREQFRRAIVDAPIPAIIFAEDGEILLINQAWTEISGYSAGELRTIPDWTERAYGWRRFEIEQIINELFSIDRRVDEADFEIRVSDGSTRVWCFSSAPLGRLPDGRRLVLSMARDVTDRSRAEEALRASEVQFRTLVETAPEGIFIQTNRRFAYANPAAVALIGARDASELIGQPVLDRFHEDDREAVDGRMRLLNEARVPVVAREEHICRPDGSTILVEVSATPFHYQGAHGALVFMRDISLRKLAEHALSQTSEQLRELSRRLMEVQEAERRLLARELHDEIGQALTAIKLDLRTARLRPETLGDRLDDATGLLDRTLAQVRDMALDLRPSILDDLGLVAALGWYVDRFNERSGLSGHFACRSPGIRVDPTVATACFRGVQEAMTNLAKHSGARHFSVELEEGPGGISLVVRDDGSGFDPDALPIGRSVGLSGMRERVEQAGGRLTISSELGAGTEVRLTFPASEAVAERGDGR
jgi:PAS domain S-box-containing protein